jgi:hypothetical protein
MPGGLLSEDVAAVCLLLADGDVSWTFDRLARASEDLSGREGPRWLAADGDLPEALAGLLLQTEGPSAAMKPQAARLGDWLARMLDFDEVFFHDNGAQWTKSSSLPMSPQRRRLLILAKNTKAPNHSRVLNALQTMGYQPSLLTTDRALLRMRWDDRYEAICARAADRPDRD